MGAGALTVGWHEMPFIVTEMDEIEREQIFVSHEQRVGAIRFASRNQGNALPVEQASFTHLFASLKGKDFKMTSVVRYASVLNSTGAVFDHQ